MISAAARFSRRFDDTVERKLLGGVVFDILPRVWIAGINIERRPAAACDDLIEPVFSRLIFITLHPMLKQVLVASKEKPYVMFVKERHVPLPDCSCRMFDMRSAMRTGGEGWM